MVTRKGCRRIVGRSPRLVLLLALGLWRLSLPMSLFSWVRLPWIRLWLPAEWNLGTSRWPVRWIMFLKHVLTVRISRVAACQCPLSYLSLAQMHFSFHVFSFAHLHLPLMALPLGHEPDRGPLRIVLLVPS
jgi:hypothetical protein